MSSPDPSSRPCQSRRLRLNGPRGASTPRASRQASLGGGHFLRAIRFLAGAATLCCLVPCGRACPARRAIDWHARRLMRAPRDTPHPAQAPSGVARTEMRRRFCPRRHRARRVDRGAACLAERDAVRRASHSRSCRGPRETLAGRHHRRNRTSSLRKLRARRERRLPNDARRASRGVEARRSAVGAHVTRHNDADRRLDSPDGHTLDPRARR
jgi:hypothetical protein